MIFFFTAMWEIIISSSILIILILILRKLFHGHINPKWQYALWTIVLLRLLIPVSFESAFSAMNAVKPVTEQIERALYQKPADTLEIQSETIPVFLQPLPSTHDALNITSRETLYSRISPFTSLRIIRIIWFSGMLITLSYILLINFMFFKRLNKRHIHLSDEIESIFNKLKLKRKIPVYIDENIGSPCLIGVFRQSIVVNPAALDSEETMRYILLHELTHYKHCDNIISIVRNFICIFYWFNPLIWIAAKVSRKDCELACDASVLAHLDDCEAVAYGKTLLSMLRNSNIPTAMVQTATTMTLDKKDLKERICLIAKKPKAFSITLVCLIILTIIIILVACTGALSNEQSKAMPDNNSKQPITPSISSKISDNMLFEMRSMIFEAQFPWMEFNDMPQEEVEKFLIQLPIQFDGFGRKESTGNSYILLKSTEQISSAQAEALTSMSIDGVHRIKITEEGLGMLCLEGSEYEFAETILPCDEISIIVLQALHQKHLMLYRNNTQVSLGLPSIACKIPYLGNRMIYFDLNDEQQQRINTLIQVAKKKTLFTGDNLEVHNKGAYSTGVMLKLSESDETFWLWSDGTLWMRGWNFGEASELLTYVTKLLEDNVGINPAAFSFDSIHSLVSAELTTSLKGEDSKLQRITDTKELAVIERLFKNAQSLQGGSGCPFDQQLTLTRSDGHKIVFIIASDSCPVAYTEEGVCLSYAQRSELERIFDEISWH